MQLEKQKKGEKNYLWNAKSNNICHQLKKI